MTPEWTWNPKVFFAVLFLSFPVFFVGFLVAAEAWDRCKRWWRSR